MDSISKFMEVQRDCNPPIFLLFLSSKKHHLSVENQGSWQLHELVKKIEYLQCSAPEN